MNIGFEPAENSTGPGLPGAERQEAATVLIVDDEDAALRLCADIAAEAGLRVRRATTTEQALGVLDEFPVDIVITDLRVPELGGLELLRRVRDYAQVRGAGKIDLPTAQAALQMLEVDRHGFDEVDRKLLLTIIEKYQGGPVGVNTLAAALAEEPDAIEEIYEPFLIQIGFMNRTPRGRVATQLAYEHFGITPNRKQASLF